eukprot:TRINITY_DN27_c0_g1_i1.p1 TRINITY_DN27_c0_g1~~TRINITY_DN27_c0_g1_i1.p1  ORF type:complete len:583 (+),score=209.04 TRINITY_DN27_c0_g1_i1:93-1841(+)
MKIIDIINKQLQENKTIFSFEYFPPKTEKGVDNLYDRLQRMSSWGPSWIDVTWGAGGSTSTLTLEICNTAKNLIGVETMMHMTCTNMPKEEIRKALQTCKDYGIQNILALRGDPPRGEDWKQVEGGFAHAIDLVKFIRAEFGNYFCVCVAGYPEGHTDSASLDEDLKFLKDKIDAGADMVISQLFYDVDLFVKWVERARALGIKVPIIPGIMPIHGYAGFARMTYKTFVPKEIQDALEPIKGDDEAVKEYGIKLAVEMCQKLLNAKIPYLHFYTLNLEKSVMSILEALSILDPECRRPLPWNKAPTRQNEDVRPIFWAHRPKSYVQRTSTWDEFPNGRWGDSRSPAFGELADYHLNHSSSKKEERLAMWGNPKEAKDVWNVWIKYIKGEIQALPWYDIPMAQESDLIRDKLVHLNSHGFLTINSQPRVNGASSTDPKVGWGPKGGLVYQKAYIEFFTSAENLKKLVEVSSKFPSLTYHAVNIKGEVLCNIPDGIKYSTAVTWGVFPHREILQPTIVHGDAFLVWKDEAFAIWRGLWANAYPEDSESRKLLNDIIDSYYLINIVDDNFTDGDLYALFDEIIRS